MTKTALQAMVEKTTVFDGAHLDISAVTAKTATLCIHAESLDTGETAVLVVADSVDNFVGNVPQVVVHIVGGISATSDKVWKFPWYDIPACRYGTASAELRLSVAAISGGTLKYEAWIEY